MQRAITFGLSLACAALLVTASAAERDGRLADAVKGRDLAAVRALIQRKVDVNRPEPDGATALHWAAHLGDAAAVELLLRAGATPSAANRYGVTPLALGVASGNPIVVEHLLSAGANPNSASTGGETVLMTAARAGRVEAVRMLLARGADVNAREATRRQTALMWAAAEGHADVVRALVEAGADLRAVSGGPAESKDLADAAGRRNRPVPRLDSFTALQFAVQAGRVEATRALVDIGSSLADETPQGLGLLAMAIANAHYEVAALLVEKGADVNAAKAGFTPLHQLVRVRTLNIGQFPSPVPTGRFSAPELGELLIKRGAQVDARTTKNFPDGHRFTFGLGATPFLLAAKGGDVPLMKVFVQHGADVRAVNANGTTAVMAAAGVEMGNPNEDSGTDADGFAALKLAVELGAGDINAQNVNGDTALHGAVFRTSTDGIGYLVERGARLDVKNKPKSKCAYSAGCAADAKEGVTPYQLAIDGLGMLGSYRPQAAALLRELMIARGLTPEASENSEKYTFGVTVR